MMLKTNQDVTGEQCIRNNDGCQSMAKVRKPLGKFTMRSFWVQGLHGIRIVCSMQIQVAVYLA